MFGKRRAKEIRNCVTILLLHAQYSHSPRALGSEILRGCLRFFHCLTVSTLGELFSFNCNIMAWAWVSLCGRVCSCVGVNVLVWGQVSSCGHRHLDVGADVLS